VALVLLADAMLRQRSTSASVVQFMVFGLVTSLAWIRVDAPDLALTEAAIGSGVTGALLLAALRRIGAKARPAARASAALRIPVEAGCLALGALLSWALWSSWPDTRGLAAAAHAELPRSGGSNPVTAVILNYRAWDTFLEMAVLWVAALCAFALRDRNPAARPEPPGLVYQFYLGRMAPLYALTLVYLVWIGARAPGGAFPAGALLGGVIVLVLLGPTPPLLRLQSVGLRLMLVAGAAIFLLVAAGMLAHGNLLAYPSEQAKYWILVIEFGCTLSIGLSFAVLFAGCAGQLQGDEA
jgi:multisubunit Na+/H+ antiporter MnhB subunit